MYVLFYICVATEFVDLTGTVVPMKRMFEFYVYLRQNLIILRPATGGWFVCFW